MMSLCRKGKYLIGCVDTLIPHITTKCEEGFYPSYPTSFRNALIMYKVFGRDYITKVFYDKFLGRYVSVEPEKWEIKEAWQVIEEAMKKSVDFLARLAESDKYQTGLERIRRKAYKLTNRPIPSKRPSLYFKDSVTILLNPSKVSESTLDALFNGKLSLEIYHLGKEPTFVPREAFFGTFNNELARQSIAVQTIGMTEFEATDYLFTHVMPYVFSLLATNVSRLIVREK